MSRSPTRKAEGSIRPVAELFSWTSRLRCKQCEKPAAVIDNDVPMCGPCFLAETLRRSGEWNEADIN
ncbi:MAG: hypothetical protein ACXVH7_08025 [Thermoanaerobaculia bacterium]